MGIRDGIDSAERCGGILDDVVEKCPRQLSAQSKSTKEVRERDGQKERQRGRELGARAEGDPAAEKRR